MAGKQTATFFLLLLVAEAPRSDGSAGASPGAAASFSRAALLSLEPESLSPTDKDTLIKQLAARLGELEAWRESAGKRNPIEKIELGSGSSGQVDQPTAPMKRFHIGAALGPGYQGE